MTHNELRVLLDNLRKAGAPLRDKFEMALDDDMEKVYEEIMETLASVDTEEVILGAIEKYTKFPIMWVYNYILKDEVNVKAVFALVVNLVEKQLESYVAYDYEYTPSLDMTIITRYTYEMDADEQSDRPLTTTISGFVYGNEDTALCVEDWAVFNESNGV